MLIFQGGCNKFWVVLVFLWVLPTPDLSYAVAEKELPVAVDSLILPFYRDVLRHGSFLGRDGLSIRYAALEIPAPKGTLVILGGRTESLVKYAELIFDLRNSGFSIYVMDHRGQGFSDRQLHDSQKGHVADFSDYVADLKVFLSLVVRPGGQGRTFVLAHSMGGAIGALYAAANPAGLDGLILCAPMLGIDTGLLPRGLAFFLARALTALGWGKSFIPGGRRYEPDTPFSDNDLTHSQVRFEMNKKFVSLFPESAVGAPTNQWAREAFRAGRQALRLADRLQIPVLLLQAGMDSTVAPQPQIDFCDRVEHCELQVIPGARHEILMEKDVVRDAAMAAISEFLQKNIAD